MSQSRALSLIEVVTGIVIKFTVATILWQFLIGPLFDYETTLKTSIYITLIFTVNGLIFGYLIRRFFNAL